MPYWNSSTWEGDVMEWQQQVVTNTSPVNFEEAKGAIGDLFKQMKIKEPGVGNWVILEDPIVASIIYFKLLGVIDHIPDIARNAWNRHINLWKSMEKLPKDELKSIVPALTICNLGEAWAPDIIDEKYVEVPHRGRGTIFQDLNFNGENSNDPDENSMQTRAMDHVVPFIVAMRDTLEKGSYRATGHTVQVDGIDGGIPEVEQQEYYMDFGFWQFIGNNLWHIFLNGYDRNPWVNAFIRLYQSCGPWIATKHYVIMVDRPEEMWMGGPRAARTNSTGPAIKWGGFSQYFLENIQVPPKFIDGGLTYEDVMEEGNAELQAELLRHYGFDNWINNSGAELLDEDVYNGRPYKLWKALTPDGDEMRMLEVMDASHVEYDPDTNSFVPRRYFVTVDIDRCTNCREARAWSARVSVEDYNLVYET